MAIGIDPERIECRKELEKLIRQLDVLILRKNIYGAEAGKSFPSWSEADDMHLNNILNKMKNNKSFRICIPDFIQYIIRADKADMEDVFRKLLDCLPGQGPVYRVNNFAVFMMQDVKKLFLAESSKYLQLLYENEKHRPELEKEFYCWIQGYRCESNAPDVFLAILEGNISVVRFYLMLGGKAGICCSQEDGASGNIQKYYVYIMEEQHGDYCGDLQKAWFCDSMTAAVLSGKIEMICFIGKYVKKLSWNEELKKSIIHASKDISGYIIKQYPDIMDSLTFEDIIEGMNPVLFDAFVQKYGNDAQKYWELLEDFLEKTYFSVGGIQPWKKSLFDHLLWKSENIKKTVYFLKKIKDTVTKPVLKSKLQRHCFIGLGVYLKKYDSIDPKLLEIFLKMADETELADYTLLFYKYAKTYFTGNNGTRTEICPNYGILLAKLKSRKDAILGYIDLYAVKEDKECRIQTYSPEQRKEILRRFRPVNLYARTDPLNRRILKKNDLSEVNTAVKYGYITRENAFALYEYALTLPRCSEDILVILLSIAKASHH